MKVILLVLDALGVGQLSNGNTYETITRKNKKLDELVLSQIINYSIEKTRYKEEIKSITKEYRLETLLADNLIPSSSVPDSFLGHLEMIGNHAKVEEVYLEEEKSRLMKVLNQYGNIEYKNGFIFINDNIVIGNNAECSPGLNINVLALRANLSVEVLIEISEKILELTNCVRVIMMYGNNINIKQIYELGTEKRQNKDGAYRWYLKIPPLQIYNNRYKVQHFGNKKLIPYLLNSINNSREVNCVELIGKVAKMFQQDSMDIQTGYDGIETDKIFAALERNLKDRKRKLEFVWVNIQKIDLFGHQEDVESSSSEYQIIADKVVSIIEMLKQNDVLLITADHGNDPKKNGAFHTYEKVPFIIISKNKIELSEFEFGNNNLTIISSVIRKLLGLSESDVRK
ncbi:hypothetical protein [Listeria innocua]|uniref:hypothetical protein n=1 Tax=Listeria innocua TaxID=1642 RepID=UPI0016246A24|nr:hypothetical protein [Listeria innocua]MBC1925135.1 hypothetical protein [Listeria innocua]